MTSAFLPEWVFAHAASRPDAPAVDSPTVRLTYRALADRVARLASSLEERGVAAGDRVLIALPHAPAAAVASLAVQSLGACAVEVDRAQSAEALAWLVQDAQARHAIVFDRDQRIWSAGELNAALAWRWVIASRPGAPEPLDPSSRVTHLADDGSLPAAASAAFSPRAGDPEAPALIVYTSGSTGRPRGVIHTFGNIDANTRSIVEYLGIRPSDRAMLVLPLHYTFGKSLLQTHLFAGGSVFLDGRFMFPRVVMEALGQEGCTTFAGVPSTYELIRREVDVSSIRMPALRYLTQAGGRMRTETIRWARQAFAPAPLFVMYGQTEATARLSYLPPDRAEEKEGSIGFAIPGVTLAVVDDDGRELPRGGVGHLVARGANVTPGYLNAPEETRRILRDGWLWTGDLARRDEDGFFFLVGRAREMLKIAGHRVSPMEIEDALLRHPDVAEAVVVGVADPLNGEAPAAFVVRASASAATSAVLQRFCREALPVYKVPMRIEFVDALPKNAAGKPLRADLAKRMAALHQGEVT